MSEQPLPASLSFEPKMIRSASHQAHMPNKHANIIKTVVMPTTMKMTPPAGREWVYLQSTVLPTFYTIFMIEVDCLCVYILFIH